MVLWQGVADSLAASPAVSRAMQALQVRTVEPARAEPLPAPVSAQAAQAAPAPRRRPAAAAAVAAEAPLPAQAVAVTPPEPAVLVAAALPVAQAAPETTAVAAAGADDVPVYRTQVPPAMTLHYHMHRGALRGSGELQWRPTASGYQARLEGRIAGFNILTWASEGGFDAAGIAPVRYTDQRRGKDVQAANFQRQAGKISFSGPSTEYPLLQGSQDRLSWMVQIAAIASADPQRLATGSRLAMFVAGARGDADVWAFKVVGAEEVTTGESTVSAIKLLREPRKPHDTRVEVWLAPSLHHLPVRARLTSEGSSLELLLQTAQPAS
jgi:hypothetical protein